MSTSDIALTGMDCRSESRLDQQQLQRARELLESTGRFEQFAYEYGFDSELKALESIARSMDLAVVDLANMSIDAQLIRDFPNHLIHDHSVVPVTSRNGVIELALGDPFNFDVCDAVSAATDCGIVPVLALPHEVSSVIKSHFGVGAHTVDGLLAQTDDDIEILEDVDWGESEAAEVAQQASVVRLVNEILTEAVHARASDIHLEGHAKGMKIRYRIDGVLQTQPVPPELNRFQSAIVSRLKIMSKMNIAERRVPQDGRIKIKVNGREIDIRVSMIPMLHGEGIVMRVLDKDAMSFSLQGIGMEDDTYEEFRRIISLPHGIVLVTGPTGSGKTTTLYSALAEIRSEKTKIITTEDPIEYQLDGINQIQVQSKVGLTFAASLRSILRHDPDVVLVGEIRDFETAENAVQASLTGHMVFSTLHTNDSAGAFMRLKDMGVEPFLVSSTVEGVMAQRLVRTLCKECRQPTVPQQSDLPQDFPELSGHPQPIYEPVGCRSCRGTGYSGRIGIYELLVTDDEIRQLAIEGKSSSVIKQAARANGMRTLRGDGWLKVLQGQTSVEEVLRVTKAD